MKPKPIVGEMLIAVEPEGRNRVSRREGRAIVTNVGRLYFSCRIGDSRNETKFHIATWLRAGENMHANFPIYLYRTEQEIQDKEDSNALVSNLSDQLRYRSDWGKLNLTQLRAIKQIIETP